MAYRAQKLGARVRKYAEGVLSFVPAFWTMRDRTIVAHFKVGFNCNLKFYLNDNIQVAATQVYEFNSSALEIVKTPFEGHTNQINGLLVALSFD